MTKGLVEPNYEGSLNQVRSSRLRKIPKYYVKKVKLIFSTNMRFSFDGQTKILRPQSASIDSAPALIRLHLFTTHRPTPLCAHPAQRVYAPTRPQQRVYATTRLRHNASTPTRPHQHVYANASEPQRVSANTSAANASSAAPTRLPQRVPTHASEPQRACSNASPPARWLPRVARRAFSQVSAPTRLLWPVRM